MNQRLRLSTGVAVIGAGQAGLSAAWHLRKIGLDPVKGYLVLDAESAPGGAWQHRWPGLTLSTVNRIHDLPGMAFADALDTDHPEVQASLAVPAYFRTYEERFQLPVFRPVQVSAVRRHGADRFLIETDQGEVTARGIINATGTWNAPHLPHYPGSESFRGRQLHTRDYRTADEFAGQHVTVVGAGISAVQLLDETSRVARTAWVSRRPPDFREGPFDDEAGRRAVAPVEDRVRRGLPPESVVSVTGLPVTPRITAMRERGVLNRLPMFSHITPTGIGWPDGSELATDVILWNTGFRSSLDHLAPLDLSELGGGIRMGGRLATMVEREPRIHLVGYGPSSSTIGANRAGGAAARELTALLDREDGAPEGTAQGSQT